MNAADLRQNMLIRLALCGTIMSTSHAPMRACETLVREGVAVRGSKWDEFNPSVGSYTVVQAYHLAPFGDLPGWAQETVTLIRIEGD